MREVYRPDSTYQDVPVVRTDAQGRRWHSLDINDGKLVIESQGLISQRRQNREDRGFYPGYRPSIKGRGGL